MTSKFILIGVLLLLAGPSFATTLLWMDVQDLTRNSTAVVMGTVTAQKILASNPGVSLNQMTFEIERTLKGDLQGTVVVNNPGFPGAPTFTDGDEAVLFIYTRNNTHVLTGFQQGSFKVVRDGPGRKVLDRRIPSAKASITNSRSVDNLISEIMATGE